MLSKDFQRTLITKAHKLQPVVMIGTKGLSENVHKEIEAALLAHELIKIQIQANTREERDNFVENIINTHQAECIQRIGHKLVIYRENSDN